MSDVVSYVNQLKNTILSLQRQLEQKEVDNTRNLADAEQKHKQCVAEEVSKTVDAERQKLVAEKKSLIEDRDKAVTELEDGFKEKFSDQQKRFNEEVSTLRESYEQNMDHLRKSNLEVIANAKESEARAEKWQTLYNEYVKKHP